MKSSSAARLYLLLVVIAAISMAYYVAGVLALREEFFHASGYAREPFDFQNDGQTLTGLSKEAIAAGLSKGNILVALNGAPFTGYAQFHDLLRRTRPGAMVEVSVRSSSGTIRHARIRIAPRVSPDFTVGQYIAFLSPLLVCRCSASSSGIGSLSPAHAI